jgi:hypothetical protein
MEKQGARPFSPAVTQQRPFAPQVPVAAASSSPIQLSGEGVSPRTRKVQQGTTITDRKAAQNLLYPTLYDLSQGPLPTAAQIAASIDKKQGTTIRAPPPIPIEEEEEEEDETETPGWDYITSLAGAPNSAPRPSELEQQQGGSSRKLEDNAGDTTENGAPETTATPDCISNMT